MFVMSEAEAAAIRAAYEQRGELSAAVELRHRFPGIASTAQARECAHDRGLEADAEAADSTPTSVQGTSDPVRSCSTAER
jgi:hypothetical protein